MIDKPNLAELVYQAIQDQLIHGTGWYRIPATPTLSQAVRKMAEEEKCQQERESTVLASNAGK